MVEIPLTAEQAKRLAPLMAQAESADGTVFSQAVRCPWPEHGPFSMKCRLLPDATSKCLHGFLARERTRMDGEAQA